MAGEHTRTCGPCAGMGIAEIAWRHNFPTEDLPFLPEERLVMATDEVPLVLVPSGYTAKERNAAFAVAVLERYFRMFGQDALNWAVGLQHRLPEALQLVGPGEALAD